MSALAAGENVGKIPDYMQPYSVIEYTSPTEYRIVKGGVPTAEQAARAKAELEQWKSASPFAGMDDVEGDKLLAPVKGVVVTYASDGYLQDIEYPEGTPNPLRQPAPPSYPGGTAQTRGVPEYYLIAKWGNHGNTLHGVRDDRNIRIGYGRGTTFNDTYGQADIKNYKGCVATSIKYDNCAVRTEISVRTYNKDGQYIFVNMRKTDAGTLPDAVIDIWKTGVELFGFTYSSNFSLPEMVDYFHS